MTHEPTDTHTGAPTAPAETTSDSGHEPLARLAGAVLGFDGARALDRALRADRLSVEVAAAIIDAGRSRGQQAWLRIADLRVRAGRPPQPATLSEVWRRVAPTANRRMTTQELVRQRSRGRPVTDLYVREPRARPETGADFAALLQGIL